MVSEYRGFFIRTEPVYVAATDAWDAQALISSTDGGPVMPHLTTQTVGHRDSLTAAAEACRLSETAIDIELEINSHMGN